MPIIRKKNSDVLRLLLVLCLGLSTHIHLQGQTLLSGIISEEATGNPMPDVICTVSSVKDSTLIQYAISGKGGAYTLRFSHSGDTVLLTAQIMGFEPRTIRIANRSQTHDIRLREDYVRLKEVVVKAEDIYQRGDTINYNVASLRSAKDTYISDVIKKLPGVEVSGNGRISYMGKPINKFYIEGMDLLGGKYTIASNSIPVDAVESVQILENHQAVKALQDVSLSERAALNLKIKKDKKLRPVGKITLGTGFDAEEMRYTGEITNLLLKGQTQSLTTLKANNQGKLLAGELSDHTYQTEASASPLAAVPVPLVNPSLGYTPTEISDKSIFNRSGIFTYNRLYRLKEETDFRINASWLDEQQDEYRYVRTIYGYSESQPLTLVREQSAESRMRQGNLTLTFTQNASNRYLNNQFRATGEWSDAYATLSGTDISAQDFEQPYFLMENKLNYIGKWRKDYLTFNSFFRFHRLPQEASFKTATDSVTVQDRSERLFYTKNEVKFNKGIGASSFALGIGLKAETNRIGSDMQTVPDFLRDSTVTSVWNYLQTELYLTPSYNYKADKWSLTLSSPLSWQYLNAKQETENEHTFRHVYVSPSASFYWRMHQFWELYATIGYNHSPGEYKNISDNYYFVNNSILRRGNENQETKKQTRAMLNLSYRNTLDALFARLTATYNRQQSNLLNGYDFIGSHVVQTYHIGGYENTYYSANANVGKILDAIQTNLNATVGFTHTAYTQYQNYMTKNILTNVGYANLTWNTDLAQWWNWSVTGQSIISHIRGGETLWMHKMQTDMTFSLGKWLYTAKLDYSKNQISPSQYKDIVLFHCTLRYKLKKDVQIELRADNLLNKTEYRLRSYSGINQFDEIYKLRPRQFMLKVAFQY